MEINSNEATRHLRNCKGMVSTVKFVRECSKISIKKVNEQRNAAPEALVQTAEEHFDRQLDCAADKIIASDQKIIFLTGPSASGKTTTAKMILERLEERGKTGTRISLDNFYKNIEEIPLWEDGSKNFETIDSLDIAYLDRLFDDLMAKGRADFPIFDFLHGRRSEKTFSVSLNDHSFIVLEGIHALNPLLTQSVDCSECMRIYVSPHSVFVNEAGDTVLSPQDLRLVRRIIRDYLTRGASAARTIDMWDDVARGEQLYIRPYREYADIHINSTHAYEPMLYKEELTKAMDCCTEGIDQEVKQRLLLALDQFPRLDRAYVPQNSLLREFVPTILNQ